MRTREEWKPRAETPEDRVNKGGRRRAGSLPKESRRDEL
jgi:hypothetical protein